MVTVPDLLRTKTVSDVFIDVTRTFGDESSVQIESSDITRWINSAQLAIAIRNPEILQGFTTLAVVANSQDVVIRTAIPDASTIQSIIYKDILIKNINFQEAELGYLGDLGKYKDRVWYERAGVITVSVPFEEDGTLKVYYTKSPNLISTGANTILSVPDVYYNSVVSYCLQQAYLLDENPNLAQAVKANFDEDITRLQNSSQAQTDYYPFITDTGD